MIYLVCVLCITYMLMPVMMVRWDKNRFAKAVITLAVQLFLSIATGFAIEPGGNPLSGYMMIAPVVMFLASPICALYILTRKQIALYKLKPKVLQFLKEWSPVLEQEILSIRSEVLRLEEMVGKARKLRKEFPDKRNILTPKIHQITGIQTELQWSLKQIRAQVNNAYILSEVGQMQEQKTMDTIKEDVLENAQVALGLADCINDAFEDEIQPATIEFE